MKYARSVRAAAAILAIATISSSAADAAPSRVCATFIDPGDTGAVPPHRSLDIQKVAFGTAEGRLRAEVTVAETGHAIGPVGDSFVVGFSVRRPGGHDTVRIGHDNGVWLSRHGFAYVNGRHAGGSGDAIAREVEDDTVVLSLPLRWLREVVGPHVDHESIDHLWARTYRTVEGFGGHLGPDDAADAPAATRFRLSDCS